MLLQWLGSRREECCHLLRQLCGLNQGRSHRQGTSVVDKSNPLDIRTQPECFAYLKPEMADHCRGLNIATAKALLSSLQSFALLGVFEDDILLG